MNFRKKLHEPTEVETGALADILFFLMMFFLMISTLASPDAIKLLLPQSSTAKTVPKETIVLAMNEKREFFVNGENVLESDLKVKIAAIATQKQSETVVLKIDKNSTIQDLTSLHDIIAELNLGMVLATEKSK